MFFDTSHNSQKTMFSNLYNAFVETATKSWAYFRCLPKERRPSSRLIISKDTDSSDLILWDTLIMGFLTDPNTDTIRDLIGVAYILLTGKSRVSRYPGYQCNIKKPEVAW